MVKSSAMEAVDFRYLLIDGYKKIGLNEHELAVLLMLDHLIDQGNGFVTADMLAMKMTLAGHDIDAILVGLLKKKFINYESVSGEMKTSLDPLKTLLYESFQKNLMKASADSHSQERNEEMAHLSQHFEASLKRTLSPLDLETISDWVDAHYQEQEIKDALEDALRHGKKNVRSVDKILRAKRAQSDIDKEGYTGVSEKWDKDIEKTLDMAKSIWANGNNGKTK